MQFVQKLLAAMQSRHLHDPRVGLAENPDLARLAARLARQTKVIRAGRHEIQSFLAPLPLSTQIGNGRGLIPYLKSLLKGTSREILIRKK